MRFVLSMLLTLVAAPAWANDCARFDHLYLGMGTVDNDPRLHAIVRQVMEIANIDGPYIICEKTGGLYPIPSIGMYADTQGRPIQARYVLHMPKIFKERASDRVLLGTFAHEFAHVVRGHAAYLIQSSETNRDTRLLNESATDVIAARWVGQEVLLDTIPFVIALIEERVRELFQGRDLENALHQIREEETIRVKAIRNMAN